MPPPPPAENGPSILTARQHPRPGIINTKWRQFSMHSPDKPTVDCYTAKSPACCLHNGRRTDKVATPQWINAGPTSETLAQHRYTVGLHYDGNWINTMSSHDRQAPSYVILPYGTRIIHSMIWYGLSHPCSCASHGGSFISAVDRAQILHVCQRCCVILCVRNCLNDCNVQCCLSQFIL